MMPRSLVLAFLSSFPLTVSLAGCGGRVSLGWDDRSNGLGSEDGGTSGDGSSGAGDEDVGDFPLYSLGGSMDGSVATVGPDGFDEIVWERWWVCGGAMCAQQMQINAECQVIWASSASHALPGPIANLDATTCEDIMTATAHVDLRDALLDPTPCSGSGGEEIIYRTYGHMGPIFNKRVEGCSGDRGAFDAVREFVTTAAADVGITEEIHR